MKLSIIIPYYNADKWIGRMLDSLLMQDMPMDEYEIIVVDDGSKDEPKVLMEYVERYPNIQYIRQENAGPGAARNTGLEKAQGDYVWFCDSDDYVAENVMSGLYRIAVEYGLDMLFFHVPRVNEGEIVENPKRNFKGIEAYATGQEFYARPIENNFRSMGVWQFIMSRSLICKNALCFPTDMIMNEDACFLIDAIFVAKNTAKVDVDVYFYVQNPSSLIHFSGKVLQIGKWCDNIFLFILKLNSIINNQSLVKEMPAGCWENLLWMRNHKAYRVLTEGCRYLPSQKFDELMLKLIEVDSYPKPFGNQKLRRKILLNKTLLKMLNIYFGIKRRSIKI